jgi:AcrR family transcriptional regulator
MPTKIRRPQRGEARSAILEVADRLFYQHGIRGVAIDFVAKEAGVTKRTLYYHFSTKRELVKAYLETRDQKTRQWVGQEAQRFGPNPINQILGIFDILGAWFAAPDYRGCPFLNAISEMTDDPLLVADAVRLHKDAVAGWFSEKLKEAKARNVGMLTGQLMLLVDGALVRSLVYRDGKITPQAKATAEVLLRQAGLAASSAKSRK